MIDCSATMASNDLSSDMHRDEMSQRSDRIRHMALHPSRRREGRNLRIDQALVDERRFFTALRKALMKQESVSSY